MKIKISAEDFINLVSITENLSNKLKVSLSDCTSVEARIHDFKQNFKNIMENEDDEVAREIMVELSYIYKIISSIKKGN
jgi:hypothetical protein